MPWAVTVGAALRVRLLAAVFAAGEPAPADAGTFALAWAAPPECPDRDEAGRRVERFLGRPVGRPGDPDVRARVVIDARDGLYVAAVSIEHGDDDGVRELRAERCDTVADAAAYVVAALIDPSATPPGDEPPPPAEPPVVTPAPPASPRAARPPAPPPRRRARWRGAARVGFGFGALALPTVAPSFVGGAAVVRQRLRIGLDAAHWLARSARTDARPDTGGDIRLTAAAVRICALAVSRRRVELPVCGGGELGSMHGTGVGIDQPARVRLLWAALSAGVGVIWLPSPWVGPWVDATLLVPLSRPVFEADNVGRIHQPGPVAITGILGVEARFP